MGARAIEINRVGAPLVGARVGREQEGTHEGYPYSTWPLQTGGTPFLDADAAEKDMHTVFAAHYSARNCQMVKVS